jgi:peptidoglycan/LPS O-acetylase OafA/YrhL
VQKIFDESPAWIRLPFVTVYGLFQPVLPATLIRHTNPIRTTITLLRGLGWYALIPLLSLSFLAATGSSSSKKRNLVLWLALFSWTWIILAALRGGGDLWDNPRYRTIMFLWQSILAGYVWVWWRETRSAWLPRIIAMGGVFLLVFIQWYASRYHHWGGQLPFSVMVALILGSWGLIIGIGWWQDRKKTGGL